MWRVQVSSSSSKIKNGNNYIQTIPYVCYSARKYGNERYRKYLCMAKDRVTSIKIRQPYKRDLECISINNNTRIFHVTSSLSLFVFFLFRRKCSRNFRVSDDAMFGQALHVQYRSQEYSNLGGKSLDTLRVAKLIVNEFVYFCFCFIPLFSYIRELGFVACCKSLHNTWLYLV